MLRSVNGVPLLGFAARSGTGKTTLLTQLIPLLRRAGKRVAVVKHSHHEIDIDKPGKDSYRLRESGASAVMLSSARRRFLTVEHDANDEPSLAAELQHLPSDGLDLILVEGFKAEAFPKIELHRPELGHPLLYPDDPSIIAIASSAALKPEPPIPWLDLNNPPRIAHFIQELCLAS